MNPLQLLLIFYGGTVVLNIAFATLQYLGDRSVVQRTLIFYWIGIAAAAVANGVVPQEGFARPLTACTGTFVSQAVLASFFAQVRGVRLRVRILIAFYIFMMALSSALFMLGIRFEAYAFIGGIGATMPIFVACYQAVRQRTRPFTMVQRMFMIASVAMSIHYLDWAYTAPRPHLVLYGFGLAFALLYLISILAATVANENLLQVRNDRLEIEVEERARQLTEANKMASVGRMAGGIAHELNNPLSIMTLKLQSLGRKAQKSTVPSEEVNLAVEDVVKVIRRVSRITDSLRNIAHKNVAGERSRAELREIVAETLDFCLDRMKSLSIDFTLSLPEQDCPVSCNSTEIAQILLNLLSNSIDAVESRERKEARKEIRLLLARKNGTYELAVEDSGYLDPSLESKVMDPFFTTKAMGHGTGLGLSISRTFAENHGGRLYLDSHSARTRFVLELPALAS